MRKLGPRKSDFPIAMAMEGAVEDPIALDNLPNSLLHIIICKLDVQSICSISLACRSLHSCASVVLPQLPKVSLVDISLCGRDLERVLHANRNVRSLTLDCRKLEDGDIGLLLKSHLQELCLWRCGKFSHRLFLEIGRHCTGLRCLSLELSCPDDIEGFNIYRASLEHMLSRLRDLECLALSVEVFDDQVFCTLPRFVGPSLKALEVGFMSEVDARNLVNVSWIGQTASSPGVRVVGGRNLQKLSLLLCRITDSLITILTQNLACLSHLELEDVPLESQRIVDDLSNWGVQQVAACTKLKRLSLVRGKGQSDASFKRVNDLGFLLLAQCCKGLESIRLGGFSQVTDTGLNGLLHGCANLHTFDLVRMCQTSDLTFHDLSATARSLIAVNLVAATKITSDSLVQLASCKNLKSLNLTGCRSVGDTGLIVVSSLLKLSCLILNGADITDAGLRSLGKGSTPLVVLSLRGCKRLTDSGICSLMQGILPATLETVDFSNIPAVTDHTVAALVSSGMQIINLRLRDCHLLTGACVSALASMQYKGKCHGASLRLLDLWNNKGIAASSLHWFKKPYFPRLRWLGLGSHLQNEAPISFVHERPTVEILWDGGELDCGIEGLLGWKPSCKEESGVGFSADD